jgi:cytochrome c biogenesis factor
MKEKEATMSASQSLERYATRSLVIGIIGAILTGLVHWGIMTSSHDFLVRDAEFLLVLGTLLIVIALSAWDLKQGMYVIRHKNEPHGRLAEPVASAGITLGVLELLPAAILLMIMLETLAFRFIPIQHLLEF